MEANETMDATSLMLVGVILLLLAASALFSGSETAFTAASHAFVTRRAREGDGRARVLEGLAGRRDQVVAAILVGNNLVNTTATALASALLIGWFGEGGVAYASLVMTALLVIFSEVLPKTLALRSPDAAALRVTPLLAMVMRVLGPTARGVSVVVALTLRLFGVRAPGPQRPGITEDELLGAIELHGLGQHGAADQAAGEERRMLRGVLELDDMLVRDVMTHRSRIVALDAEEPADALLTRLLAAPHARLPLWRRGGEEVIGVLTGRAAALPVAFVPETRPLRAQLNEFRRAALKMAVVVDEYGAVRGLITLEDIVEVVVGQIADRGEAILGEIAPGSEVEVRGDVRVRDLNREFGWSLPEDEAITVAGLAAARSRGIPEVGAEVAIGDYGIRVTERRGLRIDRVAIRQAL
jgi:Mg2+/Co2+ transporter CorB